MVWFVPDTRDETPAEAKARERNQRYKPCQRPWVTFNRVHDSVRCRSFVVDKKWVVDHMLESK